MKIDTVAYRSRVVLVVFIIAIVVQVARIKPCLAYIASAFPTYLHRTEASILTLVLFTSLLITAFTKTSLRYIALVIIGALMFYVGYRALIKTIVGVAGLVTAPVHLHILWTSSSYVMFIILAWVILGAYKQKIIGWRELAASLVLAGMGAFYLYIGVTYLY